MKPRSSLIGNAEGCDYHFPRTACLPPTKLRGWLGGRLGGGIFFFNGGIFQSKLTLQQKIARTGTLSKQFTILNIIS